MPSYKNCACAICYQPLPRPQNTCGSRECLDAWKFLGRDARLKHKNLATMSPSERAYVLASGPSQDELDAQAQARELLDANLAEHQAAEEKKKAPRFIRDMLDPANAPIMKGGDTNETS